MKLTGNTWSNEIMIFATTQMRGKDTVTYINGLWEWQCASGTFKKHTKMQYIFITLKMIF